MAKTKKLIGNTTLNGANKKDIIVEVSYPWEGGSINVAFRRAVQDLFPDKSIGSVEKVREI